MFGAPESPVAPPAGQAASVNGASGPASRERSLWEKEVLGFQFGDHPFMEAAAWLAGQLTHDTSQIGPEISGEKVKIAGLVLGVRRILTRNKSQMAVVVLEDLHGSIEGVVFPRVYERAAELFRDDAILIVEGKVDTRSDRPQIVVDRVHEWTTPAEATAPPPPPPPPPAPVHPQPDALPESNGANGVADTNQERRVLRVVVPRGEDDNASVRLLQQLHILVEQFPCADELQLVLHDRAGARVELAGADIAVKHSAELESQVRTLVGDENLEVVSP